MAIAAAGCATSATQTSPAQPGGPGVQAEGHASTSQESAFVPVVRYGRYTLVELVPTAAQQDLLLQVIDVTIPSTHQATVGDALRHVLLRSGYRPCASADVSALSALPLPAAHYRLGPVPLRDALLMLAGPGWELQVDDRTRQVCFTHTAPPPSVSASKAPRMPASPAAAVGKVERRPLPEVSKP